MIKKKSLDAPLKGKSISGRKSYSAPRLIRHGTLKELTKGLCGSGGDAATMMAGM